MQRSSLSMSLLFLVRKLNLSSIGSTSAASIRIAGDWNKLNITSQHGKYWEHSKKKQNLNNLVKIVKQKQMDKQTKRSKKENAERNNAKSKARNLRRTRWVREDSTDPSSVQVPKRHRKANNSFP